MNVNHINSTNHLIPELDNISKKIISLVQSNVTQSAISLETIKDRYQYWVLTHLKILALITTKLNPEDTKNSKVTFCTPLNDILHHLTTFKKLLSAPFSYLFPKDDTKFSITGHDL